MSSLRTDLLSATCVGINQALVGHPLDTVKVLAQTNKPWFGLPFTHYYRGVAYPLVSGVFFNATAFPVFEHARRTFANVPCSVALAGMLSGVFVTPFAAVSEGAKIARQTGLALSPSVVSRGLFATLMREMPAMTAYFSTYTHLHERHHVHPFVAGGVCGLVGWTVSYPMDVVRSRQVALGCTLWDAWKMGGLWSGYTACAGRAVLVNATNFAVYEWAREWLREDAEDDC